MSRDFGKWRVREESVETVLSFPIRAFLYGHVLVNNRVWKKNQVVNEKQREEVDNIKGEIILESNLLLDSIRKSLFLFLPI